MLLAYFALLAGAALFVLATVASAKRRSDDVAAPDASPRLILVPTPRTNIGTACPTIPTYPDAWISAATDAMLHLWRPMTKQQARREVLALLPDIPICKNEDSFVEEIIKAAMRRVVKRRSGEE